jgi:hypothetical protein
MAYTTIDKPTDYFNTKLYTGTGATQSITGVGFQPDWVWLKNRTGAYDHKLFDVIRPSNKFLSSNLTNAEATTSNFSSIDSDGFTVTNNDGAYNLSGNNYASWNWLAGGTAPAITYTVKVVSDGGNKYRFNDFGTSAVTLDLQEGGTYTFDQSDSSNSGHPLRFSTTSNGTHGGGSEYTTGVTTVGTPGSSGAKTIITVGSGVATLYYYCTQHSGMGGQANTNSLFGSSNFSGSIQSTVSANTTAGFSIVKYTGNGASNDTATIGHGLGVASNMIMVKCLNATGGWQTSSTSLGWNNVLQLNQTYAQASGTYAFGQSGVTPTSTVFTVSATSGDNHTNTNNNNYIAYCFAEKKGYSKFGSYTGNGNSDGTFVYTGFKPAWVMVKNTTDAGYNWVIYDNKRVGFNPDNDTLNANESRAEQTTGFGHIDIVSNGFKIRASTNDTNRSGNVFIYMAFAKNPFVTSTGIPTTAR